MSALKPDAVDTHDLGTTGLPWKNLHVDALTVGARNAGNNIPTGSEVVIGSSDKLNANPVDVEIYGSLTVHGATTTISSSNLAVQDKDIQVNKGGSTAASNGAGLEVLGDEVDGEQQVVGYLRVANDTANLEFKAPGDDSVLTLDINASSTLTVGANLTVEGPNASVINQDLTTDAAVTFASVTADGGLIADNLTLDGTSLALSDGDFTLDVEGDISLDANGGDVTLSDNGTSKLSFDMAGTASAVVIANGTDGDDLIFKVDAGATEIMRLDDSAGSLLMAGAKKIEFGSANAYIHHDGDDLAITDDADVKVTAGVDILLDAASLVRVDGNLVPNSADGGALGTNALEWSDLFLADEAVISLGTVNNAEVTLSHVSAAANRGVLLNSTHKLMLGSVGSFVQETAAGKILISGSAAAADAVKLASSNAGGGITLDAGTEGLHVDSEGQLLLQGAANSEVDVVDANLTLKTTNSGVLALTSAGAINATGTSIDVDVSGEIRLDGGSLNVGKDGGGALPVAISATTFDASGSGAMTLSSTTMGLTPSSTFDLNATGAATIDAASLSIGGGTGLGNGRTTGAITLKSTEADATIQTATSGKIALNSAGLVDVDAATGLSLDAAAGNITLDAASGSVYIEGAEAEEDAIHLNASNAAGGIDIDAGTSGVDLDASGLVSLTSTLNAAKAVEVVATAGGIDILATGAGAGEDIDIVATGSSVNISSSENVANAIHLDASDAAGGIDIDAGSAGVDLDTTGQVALTSSQAAATAVIIEATHADGGIDLSAGGAVVVSVDADSVDIAQDVNITGTTPTLKIGDAGAEDAAIIFDGNAVDFHIGLDDSEDKLQIGLGSALGTTPNMTLNSANRDVTFAGDIAVQGGKVTLSNGSTIDSETVGQLSLTEDLIRAVGDLTVTGNLTVSGTTTTVDSTTMTVADPLIKLNKGDTNAPARDQGIIFSRGNGTLADKANQALLWDESADQFAFVASAEEDATTAGNVTIDSYAGLKVGSLEASSFTNSGLTNDQVVLAGVGGALEGSASFTFDGNDLQLANNVGLVFSTDDAEKIESNGTDLTINSGGDINLTASSDVNIPSGVGVTFGDDGEKIEGDGTDLTIASSNKLNLTATSDVHIPANVGLVFSTADDAEKIESNDTDLTITSGGDINLTASSDINVPANVGVTFGDDGEKIEGDGTDLTITSSGKLNLTATSDVHIPAGVGLVLDGATGHEKIESDGTDISFSVGADGDINIPENIGLVFSADDAEKIESDGTDLTITSGGDIVLNATSAVLPGADSADDLGTDGTAWRKLYVDDIDLNGQGRIDLDEDADTSIRASADDVISFEIGGSDELHLNATELYPEANDGLSLGTTSNSFADLYLADAGAVRFQDNLSAADITLAHVRDAGLALKNLNTTDAGGAVLTLQTGDTDISVNDVLGSIEFQAPDEGTGTDAVEVAAAISAVSEGDFAADSNATKLSFKTGASEAATEKMSLSSAGVLTLSSAGVVIPDDATIGSASDTDAITINSAGDIAISSTTVSTSSTTGALKVAGGLGVADDLFVGGDIAVTGGLFTSNTIIRNASLLVQDGAGTDKFSVTAAGSVSCDGALEVGANLTVEGNSTVEGNTIVDGRLFTRKITAGGGVTLGNHYIYLVNADNQTITLPSAVGVAGARYVIKHTATHGGENAGTTIDANGAQTIDGSETVTLGSRYAFIEIFSDGTAWHIIGQGGTVTLN